MPNTLVRGHMRIEEDDTVYDLETRIEELESEVSSLRCALLASENENHKLKDLALVTRKSRTKKDLAS